MREYVMKDYSINSIYKSVRPLKNRMHAERAAKIFILALAVASAASMILSLVALFYPVPFLINKIAWIFSGAFAIALVAAFFSRPGNLVVLKTADALGLCERLITAYEFRNENSPIALIQRKDAQLEAERFNYKEMYRIRFPGKPALIAGGLLILTIVLFSIPTRFREEAVKAENLAREIKNQTEKLNAIKEELNESSKLSTEEIDEIKKKIEGLLKELKKAGSAEEALKAVSRSQNELVELMERERLESNLSKLFENIEPIAEALASEEKLSGSDINELKQKLKQLLNQIANSGNEERQKLSDAIAGAAQNMKGNQALSNILEALAKALATGNSMMMDQQLSELLSSLSSVEGSQGQLDDETLGKIVDALKEARLQIAQLSRDDTLYGSGGQGEKQAGNNVNGSVNHGQSGNQSNQGEGRQGGQNSGNQGQAGNQGQPGNQANSGEGGAQTGQSSGSAGNQSGKGDVGYTGNDQESSGKQPGNSQIEKYESVFVPTQLGGDGDPSLAGGTKLDSGQSYWIGSEGTPVPKGYIIPYNEVFNEYKSEAINRIDSEIIPPVMKDIVRDYFTSLE
jgi:hemoglobin-like flavoprotein